MPYHLYLCGVQLPETPEKLTLKIKNKNSTVDLLDGRTINILKGPGLTDITVPVTLPMLSAKRKPTYYLALFEKYKVKKKPTQLILTRTAPNGKLLFDTNMKVSIENYTIIEDAKNGLDMAVELNLRQYLDYNTQTVTVKTVKTDTATVKTAKVERERSADNAPSAVTYTVKSGDTLWGIAAKYLGSGAKYTEIYNANRDKISNPNLISVGQVLKIP